MNVDIWRVIRKSVIFPLFPFCLLSLSTLSDVLSPVLAHLSASGLFCSLQIWTKTFLTALLPHLPLPLHHPAPPRLLLPQVQQEPQLQLLLLSQIVLNQKLVQFSEDKI